MSPLSFFFVSLLLLIPLVSAYPDGSGGCFGTGYTADLALFKQNHGGPLLSDTGNYKLIYHIPPNRHGVNEFTPGCSYTITMCRTPYTPSIPSSPSLSTADRNKVMEAASKGTTAGVLLASKSGASDTSGYTGSFSIPKMSASLLKTMKCNGDSAWGATGGESAAVITHSDNTAKAAPINIVWTAPEDADSVSIHLLSVASIRSDWYQTKLSLTANHKYHGQECPKPITPAANVCGGTNNNTNNNNNNNNGDINDGLNTGGGDHSGHSMGHVMSGAMFSYFTTNQYKSQSIIFASWYLGSGNHYAGTVICFFLLALLSEFLSAAQGRAERYWNQQKKISTYTVKTTTSTYTVTNNNGNTNSNNHHHNNNNTNSDDEYTLPQQSIRTALYCVRSFLSMILMIAFMSMDVGFFIAVLIGYTAGFFFFSRGKKKSSKDGTMMDMEEGGGKTAACH